MTREEARKLTKQILSYAAVPEASVRLSVERRGFLRFARNEATTAGATSTTEVTVSARKGRREASASAALDLSTQGADHAALKALVARAEEMAAIAPEDPESMPLLGEQEYLDVNAWDEATASISAATRAGRVREAIAYARERKVVAAGFLETEARYSVQANSAGLFAYFPSTTAAFSVTARTPDAQGSGYAAVESQRIGSLDLREAAAAAAKKAYDWRGAEEMKPGDYPAILEPQALADIFSTVSWDARSAEEGRSVFSAPDAKTRVGERIFDERVHLYTDPRHALAPASPVGPDGYPAAKADFVREGVLKTLTSSRFWALKNERQPGPFASNMILEGGRSSLSELIANTERAVLVTRLWYIRAVDLQQALYTGLTRDGTFWVEDGEIKRPIKNFRFNESAVRILGLVEALGQTQRVGRYLMPAAHVKSFRFTSLSDAV